MMSIEEETLSVQRCLRLTKQRTRWFRRLFLLFMLGDVVLSLLMASEWIELVTWNMKTIS